jgi:hypothetical protein
MFQMQPGLTNDAFFVYIYIIFMCRAPLVVKIKEVMGNLDRDTVAWACRYIGGGGCKRGEFF